MQSLICRARFTKRLSKVVRTVSSEANNNEGSPLRRLLQDASTFGEMDPAALPEGELQWATQPYSSCAQEEPKPQTDPRETTVLLFPGQGSQYVGMGRKLLNIPAVKDLYALASEVVGWNVERVCLEGPAAELERKCQTAVLVTALGALESARESRPAAIERVRAVAGFSLGEIGALVFAGALPLEGALRLAELRQAAMAAAARERAGGMLTVWLAPDAELPRLLAAARAAAERAGVVAPVCCVANYLFPGCKVLAGDEAALRHVEREGRALGVRRAARVRVAGAFHSPLMRPAADAVRAALRTLEPAAPRVRVLCCADARPYAGAGDVRRRLSRLTEAPVRWEQTLHALFARPQGHAQPLTLALGPGSALRSTLKMVNARAWDASLQIDV